MCVGRLTLLEAISGVSLSKFTFSFSMRITLLIYGDF